MGVSFLMGIMALLSIIFGAVSMGAVPMTPEQKKVFNIEGLDGQEGAAKGIIAIGVIGLLIACLGCATGKTKNFCFAIPYGLLSFIVTVVFLILTIVASGAASEFGRETMFKAACGGTIVIPKTGSSNSKSFKSNVDLAAQYTKFVD